MTESIFPVNVKPWIVEALKCGGCITLNGRFSKERCFLEAVNDALEAAAFLAKEGIDIRPDLPSREELVAMLRATKPIKSHQGNGKSFLNWYLQIDLRAKHGVMFLISCGTGKKLDGDESQPFVAYLTELVRTTGSSALIATRMDRLTRRAWALGPLMLVLGDRNGQIGDARYGVRPVSGPESILTFFSAHNAEEEAAKMPAQMARGMRDGTGTSLATRRCLLGIAPPLPPGFFSFRSKVNGTIGPRFMTFDTPECFPDEADCASGRPRVLDPDGNVPDQVANIRWLIKTMGTPGWTFRSLATHLVANGYSTDQTRRFMGMDAVLSGDFTARAPRTLLASFIRSLKVYETGVLRINLGIEGFGPIDVTDCFPPDGKPWGTPEDFDRIRRWLAEVRPAKMRGLSFAQIPVSINGVACRLMTGSQPGPGEDSDYSMRACLAEPYDENFKIVAPDVTINFPPGLLNDALAGALIDAGDSAIALAPLTLVDAQDDQLRLERSHAETRLRVLSDERDTLRAQIIRTNDDGTPLLSGALLAEVNATFNALAEQTIPALEIEIAQLEERAAAREREHRKRHRGVALESLLALVASLRDPFDLTYRDLIKAGVRDMVITTTPAPGPTKRAIDLAISFNFVIADGDRNISIPVAVTHAHRPWSKGGDIRDVGRSVVDRIIAEGLSFDQIVTEPEEPTAAAVGNYLGLYGRRCMLPHVTDPRLARLVAMLLTSADVAEVARQTGESVPLLERIYDVHLNSRRARWVVATGHVMAGVYRAAHATGSVCAAQVVPSIAPRWQRIQVGFNNHALKPEWTYDKVRKSFDLKPCPNCGSHRRSPASIPEPVGLVCLDCRLDQGGHEWPADPYDQWLTT